MSKLKASLGFEKSQDVFEGIKLYSFDPSSRKNISRVLKNTLKGDGNTLAVGMCLSDWYDLFKRGSDFSLISDCISESGCTEFKGDGVTIILNHMFKPHVVQIIEEA
jgi:hypothetical protein